MGETTGLFGTVRHCEFCGKPLPDNYDKNFCPACLDYKLFHDSTHRGARFAPRAKSCLPAAGIISLERATTPRAEDVL